MLHDSQSKRITKRDLAFRFCFRSYGVEIEVLSNEPEFEADLAGELETALAGRLSVSAGAPDARRFVWVRNRSRKDTVYVSGSVFTSRMERPKALAVLVAQIRHAVAEHSTDFVFVHSGAVGWNGRVILLPGQSYAGKSTLVTALVKLGAEYFSDEYAVIDSEGAVHPFPKPISLRAEAGRHGSTDIPAPKFGGVEAAAKMLPSLVVFTRYKRRTRFAPVAMTRGAGVLELIRNTIPIRHNQENCVRTLTQTARFCRFFRSPRGEADACAALILELAEKTNG